MPWADCFMKVYHKANKRVEGCSRLLNQVCNSWHPPYVGLFKVNSNAAVDTEGGRIGIGLIIYDSLGFVMVSSAQTIVDVYSPQEAETIAILHGIQIVVDSGLVPFSIKSDAQVIVNLVNNGVFLCSEVGLNIKGICLKLESFSNVSIDFFMQKANMATH
ncbi:hypothetical protein Ddye_030696 [Dipteronia dyeriana]|uniref:RNase H type-1 domain-containing protein n=1 Tax=Dipteronia dyeriana TaxID=168575 RepID=A0AAD9TGV9_9ROSI|nr:hypothetical protein Ddye_030696 [Dipteronia dyeriana]